MYENVGKKRTIVQYGSKNCFTYFRSLHSGRKAIRSSGMFVLVCIQVYVYLSSTSFA